MTHHTTVATIDRASASPSPTGTSDATTATRRSGMLVLTRKPAETIEIGGGIRVTLISAGNGRARVGITAPRDVDIVRGELAAGWSRRTRLHAVPGGPA